MSTRSLGVYQVGEVPFDFLFDFLDSVGSPIDITGWSASSTVTAPDGTTLSPTAAVDDGAAGRVSRVWLPAMTAQTGLWREAVTVTDGTYTLTSATWSWIVESTP